MAYTINTNITSLQAQEYLRVTTEFQSKTIQRVTSGLRIVSSGDDAAGLAIANAIRSDRAVLTQGIRNANDGLSTLQTIDGGINNISQLLDRARTLAAQSASGTFTGDRNILNSEFQSVLQEIDRQAQAIGLDQGGAFARSLSVFIGGGRANSGITAIDNGSVSVDLSRSTVDTRSLGLSGFEVAGADSVDLADGQATSVYNILNNATNISSAGDGFTDFYFYGPGFGDANRVKVSVNTSGVSNIDELVAAINSAIEDAGNGTTEAAAAFKNAQIQAAVKIDADGSKRLSFTSSNAAFQVRAGDRMANALLGNVTSATDPTGKAMDYTVQGGAASAAASTAITNTASGDKIVVRFQGGGLSSPVDITIDTNTYTTVGDVITNLQTQIQNNAALQAAGISMTGATAGSALAFTSSTGEAFEVLVAGDVGNQLGLGSYRLSGSGGSFSQGTFDYTTITGSGSDFATADITGTTFEVSIAGGPVISLGNIQATGTDAATRRAAAVDALNDAFLANAATRAAQLVAVDTGTDIQITSQNGTYFRLNVYGADAASFGFDDPGAADVAESVTAKPTGYSTTIYSGGVSTVEASDDSALDFSAIRNATDDQTITVTVADNAGNEKSLAIVLANDGLTVQGRSGATLDQAVAYINSVLQTSNDTDFQKIVAVKERIDDNNEGIRFISSGRSFKVTLGTNTGGGTVGINDSGTQGTVMASEQAAGGSRVAIDTQEGAEYAVSALADAVSRLGSAQAVVGKGQNQFNFAVSLAQTQLNNLAASESRIRDADLAAEAANLTKAQILQQAGIAALAQANVAPQAVLSLLRG